MTAHQDRNIHAFLNVLVEQVFSSFDESSQQEIIFLLVVAIGNGNAAQKDSAIDTLTYLIKLYVKKVLNSLIRMFSASRYIAAMLLFFRRALGLLYD